jgi:hypothetical protein
VTEKGTATAIAADGEIPYKLTPNERSDYADLSGKDGAFATIDYSMNPPWAFVGSGSFARRHWAGGRETRSTRSAKSLRRQDELPELRRQSRTQRAR